jgi:lysine N6-hydroxylase
MPQFHTAGVGAGPANLSLAPLDDSPTANEMYRPADALSLNRLPNELKRDLVKEQVLTSDRVSASTLRALFQLN